MIVQAALYSVLLLVGVLASTGAYTWLDRMREKRARNECPACRGTVWLESLGHGGRYAMPTSGELVVQADRMGLCPKHAHDYVALQFVREQQQQEKKGEPWSLG